MTNQCKNRRFLMAQNHVWRYTLRLFYTFAIFEKHRKIDAKMYLKSTVFWLKIEPWALQGGLILRIWRFLGDSKNDRFFDVGLGRRKIDRNHPGSVQGSQRALRHFAWRYPGGTSFRPKYPGGASRARVLSVYKIPVLYKLIIKSESFNHFGLSN